MINEYTCNKMNTAFFLLEYFDTSESTKQSVLEKIKNEFLSRSDTVELVSKVKIIPGLNCQLDEEMYNGQPVYYHSFGVILKITNLSSFTNKTYSLYCNGLSYSHITDIIHYDIYSITPNREKYSFSTLSEAYIVSNFRRKAINCLTDTKYTSVPCLTIISNNKNITSFSKFNFTGLGNIKFTISYNSNYIDAINNLKGNWIYICPLSAHINHIYKTAGSILKDFTAVYQDHTLFLTDNPRVFQQKFNQLQPILKNKNYDIVGLNQYHLEHQSKGYSSLFNKQYISSHDEKTQSWGFFAFPNSLKTRIGGLPEDNARLSGHLWIPLSYKGNPKKADIAMHFDYQKKRQYDTYGDILMDYLIFPYGEKDSIKQVYDVISLYEATYSNNITVSLEQKELIQRTLENIYKKDNENETDENDVLNLWFQKNIRDGNSDKEQIRLAYVSMKNKLLDEYKRNQVILKGFDLSKKYPIPGVKCTKRKKKKQLKYVENFIMRTQHINLGNSTVEKGTIYFEDNVFGRKKIETRQTDLMNLYDKQLNEITLNNK